MRTYNLFEGGRALRIAFGTTLMMLIFVSGVSALDYDLTGNAQVIWNTTIQDGIDFAVSPNIDFDMDGSKDIIVGRNEKTRLISGSNGAEKWVRTSGGSAGGGSGGGGSSSDESGGGGVVDDIDGDGGNDIYVVINSYYEFLNGKTGTPLWNKNISLSPDETFYINIGQGIGDISDDNKNDLIISSYLRTNSNGLHSETYNVTGVIGVNGIELWNRQYSSQQDEALSLIVEPNVVNDLNKDGNRDVLINLVSDAFSGIQAVNGYTGSLLWNLSDTFGTSAYTDLNGDGSDDVILASYNTESSVVETWAAKGNDGSQIWGQKTPGSLMNLIDDINGDGRTDVVLGSMDQLTRQEKISIVSGTSGSIIWSKTLGVQGWPGVNTVNDIDSDGKRDLIVISMNETYDPIKRMSYMNFSVQALSGKTGNIIWTKYYYNYLNAWAWFDIAGDLTGDNKQDICLEIEYQTSPQDYQYRLNTTVLNVVNGDKLWEMNNIAYDMVPDFLGDFNGDNKGEVLIYRNYYYPAPASFGIQSKNIGSDIDDRYSFAKRQIEILGSNLNPQARQQLIEGFITWNSVRTGKLSTESNIMSASGSNYARAFTGDNFESTIWNISSNNNIWSVLSPQNIDMNADGITDKAITIGNTIYLLEKNVPTLKSVSININNGEQSTNSRSVVLTLSAENAVNMRFKNENSDWTNPEPYSSAKQWELSSGDGLKTVFLEVKNDAGTIEVNDTIWLDTNPPAVINVTLNTTKPKQNSSVNISVNVSDRYLNISSIVAEVKHPGGFANRSSMSGEGIFYTDYYNTSEYGKYEITIFASDEAGNINSTEKTWFVTTKTSSKGAVLNGGKGETANGSWEWNSSNFLDFVHNENLKAEVNVDIRNISRNNLWYNTSREIVRYKVNESTGKKVRNGLDSNGDRIDYSGGYYDKIGWIGESYVAINGSARKLSKLVLEQSEDDIKELTTGETWILPSGYSLNVKSVNASANPRSVKFVLNKDGGELENTTIIENEVYTYTRYFVNESDVPVFVTYVDNISSNSVRLKYSWLISELITQDDEIWVGDVFGNLIVSESTTDHIKLTNRDTITLSRDSNINITDELYFKVLDSENLSYYPYFNRPKKATTIEMPDNDLSLGDISVNESVNMNLVVTQMSEVPPGMSSYLLGLNSLNKYIDIEVNPEVIQHLESVILRIYYTPEELGSIGEGNLKLLWYNETSKTWEIIPEQGVVTVDTGKYGGYVWAKLTHLSMFTLAATVPTPPQQYSSGGSSGGGGGGGGSSGENYTNIEVIEKYDMQISKDVLTSYRFIHEKNPIMFVNITGNTSIGIITTSAEVLKNTSTLVKMGPEWPVYKNINIWVGTSGFATPKNIKQALIKFRVETSWINSNNLAGSDIKLLRWDSDKWVTLETLQKDKDSTYTYFEGETTSFSPFAISGLKAEGISSTSPSTPTMTTQAGTATATTGEPTPPTNLYLILGVIAIIAIIAVIYLKYK